MLGKGNGGLYKSPTKEERRKRTAKRRGRDLRFEKWPVVGFGKRRRKQDVP